MDHKKKPVITSTAPITMKPNLTEKQMECVAEIFSKKYKTHTFDECIQIYFDTGIDKHGFDNFEKLSSDRVKLLKKGEKHVKTLP